uniref:Uncharacterized protein n=1 Tax=Helianthus annuus TaxID=4232 RepID=A0A251SJ92_HELAN
MSPSHLKYLHTPKITLCYTLDLSLSRVQFGDNHQTPTSSHTPAPSPLSFSVLGNPHWAGIDGR